VIWIASDCLAGTYSRRLNWLRSMCWASELGFAPASSSIVVCRPCGGVLARPGFLRHGEQSNCRTCCSSGSSSQWPSWSV